MSRFSGLFVEATEQPASGSGRAVGVLQMIGNLMLISKAIQDAHEFTGVTAQKLICSWATTAHGNVVAASAIRQAW